MRTTIASLALIAGAHSAAAHEGHIAPMSGHAHGEILALIVAVIALGIYVAGRRA
ncbi:MAG: hypothetical protein AAGD13_12860 [Pseudomonadota bacterium]